MVPNFISDCTKIVQYEAQGSGAANCVSVSSHSKIAERLEGINLSYSLLFLRYSEDETKEFSF